MPRGEELQGKDDNRGGAGGGPRRTTEKGSRSNLTAMYAFTVGYRKAYYRGQYALMRYYAEKLHSLAEDLERLDGKPSNNGKTRWS